MTITAFDLAQRFVGLAEVNGALSNPQILAFLRLDDPGISDDTTPWCSAFVNWISWLLRLPRSKSLSARSNLNVGTPTTLGEARVGFDIVVFWRDNIASASGHVGFYAGRAGAGADASILVLGGNQGDRVSIEVFPVSRLLGVRRLA